MAAPTAAVLMADAAAGAAGGTAQQVYAAR